MIGEIIPIVLLVLCLFVAICLIASKFSNNLWFCNFWGWHTPKNEQGFDGMSFTSYCKRCDKRILQDSEGNWF